MHSFVLNMSEIDSPIEWLRDAKKQVSKRNLEDLCFKLASEIPSVVLLIDCHNELKLFIRRCIVILKSRCSGEDSALWKCVLRLINQLEVRLATGMREKGVVWDDVECQRTLEMLKYCKSDVLHSMPDVDADTSQSEGQWNRTTNVLVFEGQLTDAQRLEEDESRRREYREELDRLLTSENVEDVVTGMQMMLAENSNQVEGAEEEVDEAVLDEVYKKAPPASKTVVSGLERVVVSSKSVVDSNTENGTGDQGDASCPVCMQELCDGDTVVVLPCKHGMHPECIGPWLEQTNSCPTCRSELPTDDARYEKYKVKKRQDEIDRKGAANAISHHEFFYI